MNFRKDEDGQVLVLTALSMIVLFGFLAFAIDVGLLFNAKRKLQNAVDAAATSAAIDYMFNTSTTTATTAANDAVTANGISNAAVTVNFHPSITSPYHNSNEYVEVIIIQPNPTIFMGLFNQSSVNVAVRAVAGMPGPGNACVIVLSPHGSGAMTLQGSFDVSANKCGIVVNSDASDALTFTGGGGTLSAGYVAVVGPGGGAGVSGYHDGESTPAPVTGATPVNNPLVDTIPPDPSTMTCKPPTGGTLKIKGVTYYKLTGTPTAGCYSGNVEISNATLGAGTYVFSNGNVLLDGNVDGTSGITLDLNSGGLMENAGTTIHLVAPGKDSGSPYAGDVIIAPASNTSTVEFEFGNTAGILEGIIYLPGGNLFLHDSGGDPAGGLQLTTDLIVNTLVDQTATLTLTSYTSSFGYNSPLTAVALVE